jgi:hypothetical protein
MAGMDANPTDDPWQPMDTAPKDGTKIIVCTRDDDFVPWVFWDGKDWMSDFIRWNGCPIAWMPFPPSPSWVDADD